MSDQDDDEDLECLRQAALNSLVKKNPSASATSTNAVFYRPSANSNLISIQPVVSEYGSKGTTIGAVEDTCSTDSENEIVIAEGLSVSSSDCDEIVEEVIVSGDEEDDENTNIEEKAESSEGEDAVSVASKDSFDEILNSIEEEINGGIKKKPASGASTKAPTPKKRKGSLISNGRNNKPLERKKAQSPLQNREPLARRSKSPNYRRSSEGRRPPDRGGPSKTLDRNRDRSHSKSRRSRSRSGSRGSHSTQRNESRRIRSPVRYRSEKYLGHSTHSSNNRHGTKSPTLPRRHRSRSPFIGSNSHKSYKSSGNDRRSRSSSNHRRRTTNTRQDLRPIVSRRSNSPQSHNTKSNETTTASKRRSRSPVKKRTERTSKSPFHGKGNSNRRIRSNESKRSPTPQESRQNLSKEEREVFEKRKRKFQSSNFSKSSGKVVLKADAIERDQREGSNELRRDRDSPSKKIRMIDDSNIIISDVINDKQNTISRERYERKLKLSDRLGIKVHDEDLKEDFTEQKCSEPKETEKASPGRTPPHETISSVMQSNKCSGTKTKADVQKSMELNKEDLRSKLEQKRASGGGRLFTFALRDTFDENSGERKSRRKATPIK